MVFTACSTTAPAEPAVEEDFSFYVTADMREFAKPEHHDSQHYLGACEAMRALGTGSFMVSPGDLDPPEHVLATIRETLGDRFPWYPVVGNHESETPEDMAWLREYGSALSAENLRRGPAHGEETTYSFDHGPAHFVVINQYCDGESDVGTNGDVTDPLYEWVRDDLARNTKPIVFVVGHEPFVSIPDFDSGRLRHKGDNLDAHPENSHRFHQLLRTHEVTAYLCGHTHDFSFAKLNGVWQIDSGHARGIADVGAPSTFLEIHVAPSGCRVDVWRDDANGGAYSLTRSIPLD